MKIRIKLEYRDRVYLSKVSDELSEEEYEHLKSFFEDIGKLNKFMMETSEGEVYFGPNVIKESVITLVTV